MEFPINRERLQNLEKYSEDELDIAYKFSKRVHDELAGFVRGVVLFGSAARQTTAPKKKEEINKPGDIDILLIVDDVTVKLGKELVQTYRVIVEKIVREVSGRLHIITLKFSSFWEYVRAGDPVAVNVLRDGVPIIDTGFFEPLQMLLKQGRVRPSPESIMIYFNKAPLSLKNSEWHVLQAIIDLYWAVIDAAHAALMKLNEVPPSPEHVAELLNKKLIKTGILDKKFSKTPDNFFHLMKGITHGEIKEIKGEHYDQYYKEASAFVKEIEKFLNK
ncbi:hypothetical protein ACFL1B_03385 [Nanoarchaeota archaeon]